MERAAGAAAVVIAVQLFHDLDAVVLLTLVCVVLATVVVVESVRLREFRRSLVAHEP